jgi:hypothetical protein
MDEVLALLLTRPASKSEEVARKKSGQEQTSFEKMVVSTQSSRSATVQVHHTRHFDHDESSGC